MTLPNGEPGSPDRRLRWMRLGIVVVVLIGLVAVAARSMSDDGRQRRDRRDRGAATGTDDTVGVGEQGDGSTTVVEPPATDGTGGTGTDGGPSGTAGDVEVPTDPLPTGAVTAVATSTQAEPCALDRCEDITVSCPGLPDTTAVVATRAPASPRGLVAFFSGGTGKGWWAEEQNRGDAEVLQQLGDAGLEVVMVRWVDGWARTDPGAPAGFASVACRPATVVRWLHDDRYVPLGASPQPGTCGFCLSGNSGGASQAAYSLTHYGLDTIVDAAILSSGPPHAALVKGCLRTPGEEAYWYDRGNEMHIDTAYGVGQSPGPCAAHDPAAVAEWTLDAVDTGGSDYRYDTTRVAVILGENDPTIAPMHAEDFVARLRAAGSPWVSDETASAMTHSVTSSQDARDRLVAEILGAP